MLKYIFNKEILGVFFGAVAAIQMARHGRRGWRLVLTWIGLGISLAIAIGTVRIKAHEHELEKKK